MCTRVVSVVWGTSLLTGDLAQPGQCLLDEAGGITLQAGLDKSFSRISHALDFLERDWPMRSNGCHDAAVSTCRRA
ncbi:DUF982 domain-containing protein [Rhizobium sp. S96]|uniref:DUF982 domain-containing protein n=1 Tax=unclassified Rhizobium TaxID=2613769 RepID=UPI0009F47016